MTNYKITLYPLEKFFFGGENVFGADGGQDERRRSYLVKSNLLPQQTTLLGVIREQLLAQNNLLLQQNSSEDTQKKAIQLVGPTGFSPENSIDGYGVIKGLSPLLIQDETDTVWQPAALDDREIQSKGGEKDWLGFEIDAKSGKPFLKNFDPKADFGLMFADTGSKRKSPSDFFGEYSQVGITMTNRTQHRGLNEDQRNESYYRQTFRANYASSFSGNGGFAAFVFYVQMDGGIANFNFGDNVVYMGGERSAFRMKVEKQKGSEPLGTYLRDVTYGNSRPLQSGIQRIVLLSDAYADSAVIKQHSFLAITQVTPFRYFTTILDKNTRYFDFKKDAQNTRSQSGLYQLLSRGSVIYAKSGNDLDRIASHINDQKAFQQIGYNFIKIN